MSSATDLFGDHRSAPAGPADAAPLPGAPLAERLRPASLDDVIGQRHLIGAGMPLASAIASGRLHSMILWGPPGVGKTTLARLLARSVDAAFLALSAVLSGVKEIREAIGAAQAHARAGRRTVLFVDEVHRFNKAQQDAFLPHVESGLVVFIGATTENPSFEVNSALLSRAAVYVLQPLSADELGAVHERALAALRAAGQPVAFDDEARALLIGYADGDARRLVNMIEQIADAVADSRPAAPIDRAGAQRALAHKQRRFDKGGEAYYDQISALHKSVRGSAPDAALYWLCRMLDGGADPLYLGRRIVRMASEDIGLADPRALRVALDACESYERLGTPEGELALANAILYLCAAPKSNAAYRAYGAARRHVDGDESRPVPLRLRNAPTRLMKDLGYGDGYRYAHDEPDAYAVGERYLPDGMPDVRFYQPTGRGLEAKIREKFERLRARERGPAVDDGDAG